MGHGFHSYVTNYQRIYYIMLYPHVSNDTHQQYPYCTCIVHITIPHFRWLNRWNPRCRQKRCLRSSFCTSMLEAAGRSQVPWDPRATRCGRRYLEGQWSSLSCASYWELRMSHYVIQYHHSPIIHYSQFCWVKTINSMAHLMNWATDVFLLLSASLIWDESWHGDPRSKPAKIDMPKQK